MDWIIWTICFVGHIGLWCVVFNRVHATAWPRSTRKLSEKLVVLAVILPFVWVASLLYLRRTVVYNALAEFPITQCYVHCCLAIGCLFALRWVYRKWSMRLPKSVIRTSRETIRIAHEIDKPLMCGGFAGLLGRFPFNEALTLSLQRMTFAMDIPAQLDGLKICQLSDLHFTGHIDIEYFKRIVKEANDFEPDLIFITGDIVDAEPCLDWIKPTLGELKAKLGVFYVLGNHDRRIKNEAHERELLAEAGVTKVAGNWCRVKIGENEIQITGNALPWYRDAESLGPPPSDNPALRILLSHSPDQLDWAKQFDFDLMFAGHTHGGQVQIPVIGPIVAPSKYGIKYASGTFQIDDMVMHVSRGISGDEPIRLGSPPELGVFTIRSKAMLGRDLAQDHEQKSISEIRKTGIESILQQIETSQVEVLKLIRRESPQQPQ